MIVPSGKALYENPKLVKVIGFLIPAGDRLSSAENIDFGVKRDCVQTSAEEL